MDKTKIYIKMADHPEIQKYFTNKCGDFICGSGTNEGYNCGPTLDGSNKGRLIFFKPFPISCPVEKHDRHWYYTTAEFGDGWGGCIYFKNLIWLPRQDKIQGMLFNAGESIETIIDYLYDFATSYLIQETMEKLWLAFYMHERHQMKWLPEKQKWIKI